MRDYLALVNTTSENWFGILENLAGLLTLTMLSFDP